MEGTGSKLLRNKTPGKSLVFQKHLEGQVFRTLNLPLGPAS